jgi:glucosylceramidase
VSAAVDAAGAGAPPLQWVLSARDDPGARLAPQAPLWPVPGGASAPLPDGHARLWVDTRRRFQTVLGFGGAITEAAATVWQGLSAEARDAVLRDCFCPHTGHGYTLVRVHMNSCDFSLGHYAHAAVPDDAALAHFSIERDRQSLLPMLRAAQAVAGRPLRVMLSPWSPPAWMKTNGQMADGGRLKPEWRAAWAQCFVQCIQAYEAEGVPIWAVSVQNEPEARQRWDSCLYSAEEERDFVRDHLGPALHAAGLAHVKLVVWDHNRDAMVERASVIYGDPQAARYVWGLGFHWYVEDHFEHVQQVHDAWPDKHLLFTEGCQEGGPHHGRWEVGERYARSMIHDLNHWTEGWIDWNVLLDAQGGPNHVGNFCSAPLLADGHGGVERQTAYAAIGHLSRYVRPGARRVLCAATREALECSAFTHPDGRTAVVVLNRSDHALAFRLVLAGEGAPVAYHAGLPPHAMATFTGVVT